MKQIVMTTGAGTAIGVLTSRTLAEAGHSRRTVADVSDYGAELINGAAEELRLRLARRMHLTDLLEEPHGLA